jgi:nucleoside-diphosphate-sugar epimerase
MHGVSSLLAVWSHPNFEFIHGDVRDHHALQSVLRQTDAVIQLAAIVGDPACARQPELARAINLDASLALLEESRKTGVSRFVFASTCSNYGKMNDSNSFVDETSELRPVSLYAETKVAVERTLLDPTKTGQVCATALRFATIFGVSPRMRFDLTVNEFTMEMLTKRHLVVFGEQFWRPYVHVRDVARAVTLVLEAPICKVQNQVFNVGANDQNYQKQQLVELIRVRVPDAIVEYVHKDEDPRDYRVSFTKIKNELGFGITRTVQDGIAEIAKLVGQGAIQDFDDPRYRN